MCYNHWQDLYRKYKESGWASGQANSGSNQPNCTVHYMMGTRPCGLRDQNYDISSISCSEIVVQQVHHFGTYCDLTINCMQLFLMKMQEAELLSLTPFYPISFGGMECFLQLKNSWHTCWDVANGGAFILELFFYPQSLKATCISISWSRGTQSWALLQNWYVSCGWKD